MRGGRVGASGQTGEVDGSSADVLGQLVGDLGSGDFILALYHICDCD